MLEPVIGPVGGLTRSGELDESNGGSAVVEREEDGLDEEGAEEFAGGAAEEGAIGPLNVDTGGRKVVGTPELE